MTIEHSDNPVDSSVELSGVSRNSVTMGREEWFLRVNAQRFSNALLDTFLGLLVPLYFNVPAFGRGNFTPAVRTSKQ